MEKYVVHGGHKLHGSVDISGAKNAAVAILPATVLVEGIVRIENIPNIIDVKLYTEMLYKMGANVRLINKHTIEIDNTNIQNVEPPYELVRKMRASYYLIGAMLGRFGEAKVALPGGCDFGVRPIDQHVKGFDALGASVTIERGGLINAIAVNGLSGNTVYFDLSTVGATINVILAAVRANGQTIIENAAKEPHIVDLANFLNACGADIMGAGTDTIKIRGVNRLHGCTYSVIPDQIEAGTFMVAAAAVGGQVEITNVIPKHLESITAKLIEMGVEVVEKDDSVVVIREDASLTRINIKTLPYPGFPTDMQPQMGVLLSIAEGTSILTEGVFDNRFRYVDELKRMGAQVSVDGKIAVFEGVRELSPALLKACDLRAGAALVIAALAASGVSEIEDITHIERGYEDMVEKFRKLGADIRKITTPDGTLLDKAN